MGFIGGFLHPCGAASFFGARGQRGFAAGALKVGDLLGVPGAGVGMPGLFSRQPVRLQAGRGQRQSDGDSGGAVEHHLVTAFWLTLAAR